MNDYEIRLASPADLEPVYECYKAVCAQQAYDEYGPMWDIDVYPARKDMQMYIENGGMLAAWQDGKILGTLGMAQDETSASLHLFAIRKEARGTGLAKAMLKAADDWAQKHNRNYLWLEIVEGNIPAQKVYEKAGYEYVRTQARLLQKPDPIKLAWFEKYLPH